MDLLMGMKLSSPTSASKRKKIIHRTKRNRFSFQQNSYSDYLVSGGTDEVRPEDDVDNSLKKLKVNDVNDVEIPMSRRLPIINHLDEKSDVDFITVNQVLNELHHERCFRRNLRVYSAVADSLSNNLYDNSKDSCFVPKGGVTSSTVQKFGQIGHSSIDSLDSSGCSSMPP